MIGNDVHEDIEPAAGRHPHLCLRRPAGPDRTPVKKRREELLRAASASASFRTAQGVKGNDLAYDLGAGGEPDFNEKELAHPVVDP